MRIDKYLKNYRIIKRRTMAHEACTQESVFVNDKVAKPGTDVKEGDEILIRFGNGEMHIRVLATPDHVTKDMAPTLYEIIK